jgi:hypothetical protein|tara:strand:- start:65 stop:439 length:375 start_codon:yes stop_codon:yes gene_type:complete
MTKYSHMLDIAFTVISEEDDGSDITPEQIHVAIAKRLVSLAEANEYDIGGAIGITDTYEIEEQDPTIEELEAALEATRKLISNQEEFIGLTGVVQSIDPSLYRREREQARAIINAQLKSQEQDQ